MYILTYRLYFFLLQFLKQYELPQNKCYRRKTKMDNFYREVINGALLKKFVEML